mgnify:CR=1 FL=1
MTIYSATLMGTYEEFLKIFKEGDQNEINASRESLLFTALCNTKSKERYRIANFLINKGADVKIITEDGMSMFFPLFSLGWQDIIKTTILCKTLLEKGADITVIHKKEKTVSFKELFNIGAPEMEMLPLYQLIFSQPGLPLLVKDKWGLTVIEFARKFNRPIAVKMMEDYVKKYNLKEDS